jgi:hypothetical protein
MDITALSMWFERLGARFLFGLPAPIQRWLCGGRATRVNEQTLCAEMRLMLMTQRVRRGRVSLAADSVQEARTNTGVTEPHFATCAHADVWVTRKLGGKFEQLVKW